MKTVLRFFALLSAVLVFAGMHTAQAAEAITAKQVGQFVEAIPDIEKFSEEMKETGKDQILEDAVKPKPGETQFEPYSKGVTVMKAKLPEEYTKLGSIVGLHGFASQEGWATVGDNVMKSYMAVKMEGKNQEAMQAMAAMPEEAKANLPPEAQAQIKQALEMMKVLEAVPSENKEAVRPHLASIDAWLQKAAPKKPAPAAGAAE